MGEREELLMGVSCGYAKNLGSHFKHVSLSFLGLLMQT